MDEKIKEHLDSIRRQFGPDAVRNLEGRSFKSLSDFAVRLPDAFLWGRDDLASLAYNERRRKSEPPEPETAQEADKRMSTGFVPRHMRVTSPLVEHSEIDPSYDYR